MYTEEEAKKKWCPFARVAKMTGGYGIISINRGGDYCSVNSYCIASDCMAWRWDIPDGYIREAIDPKNDAPEHLEAVGYCGLSGRPE